MRSFHFRLERALEISRARERHLEERLGQALRDLGEVTRLLDEAERRLLAEIERRKASQQGDLQLAEIHLSHAYFLKAQRALAEKRHEAALAAAAVEIRRADLLAAREDRQALEKLRERRLAAYQLEALRREQKEMDEIAARLSRSPA